MENGHLIREKRLLKIELPIFMGWTKMAKVVYFYGTEGVCCAIIVTLNNTV